MLSKKCKKNKCACSSEKELERGQLQLSERRNLVVSDAVGHVQQLAVVGGGSKPNLWFLPISIV